MRTKIPSEFHRDVISSLTAILSGLSDSELDFIFHLFAIRVGYHERIWKQAEPIVIGAAHGSQAGALDKIID